MRSPRPVSAVTETTGPRLAHSSETACGPRSHRPPLSRRQGVLKGLECCQADPSHTAQPPAQPPWLPKPASQALTSGWNGWVKKTTDATPASATAAASWSASAAEMATGFSRSRCLPARAACTAIGHCTSGGTEKATASTSARNASRSRWALTAYSAASSPAASRLRPQTAANSMPSVAASAGACVTRAQWPVPTSPNLSGGTVTGGTVVVIRASVPVR